MPISALATSNWALSMMALKKAHLLVHLAHELIRCLIVYGSRKSLWKALPIPYQLGTMARLCIQLNIQGMARIAAKPPFLLTLAPGAS